MFQKFFPLLAIGIWGVVVFPLSRPANASTPLTQAQIQDLRNLVQLIPKNTKKRPARKLDPMRPGDGLSTGRESLADLRFNDGSVARVGEQAVFQFLPKTRNFRLSNGTVLLLIPPGRGQTRIQTPNAAAAIRGSALFVRYDAETDTTIVGALTNSGIEVSNKEASCGVLEAGQLVMIVKGKCQGLLDFDLRNFYETSDLVRGLDLNRQNLAPSPDPAIASVQAETSAAIATQTPIIGEGVLENPSFLQLTPSSSDSPSAVSTNSSDEKETLLKPSQDNSSVDPFVDTGEVQLSGQPGNNSHTDVNNTQSVTKPEISLPNPSQPTLPKPDNEPLPKPPEEQPKPPQELPKPDNEPLPKPPEEQPKPPEEQPKPPEEQPKPPEEQPKPPEEQPKPPEEQPKPPEEQPKPPEEQPKPPEEQPKPPEEQPKPPEEQPNPPDDRPTS
jgi:FecR protein